MQVMLQSFRSSLVFLDCHCILPLHFSFIRYIYVPPLTFIFLRSLQHVRSPSPVPQTTPVSSLFLLYPPFSHLVSFLVFFQSPSLTFKSLAQLSRRLLFFPPFRSPSLFLSYLSLPISWCLPLILPSPLHVSFQISDLTSSCVFLHL